MAYPSEEEPGSLYDRTVEGAQEWGKWAWGYVWNKTAAAVLAGVILSRALPPGCSYVQNNGSQLFTKNQVDMVDVNGDGVLDVVQRNYIFEDAVYLMQTEQKDGRTRGTGVGIYDADATESFDSRPTSERK